MTALSKITLLLLCCSIISSQASKDDCDIYKTKGEDFSMVLDVQMKEISKLRWMYNNELIFDSKTSSTDRPTTKIPGSILNISQNGSLTLTNLQKEHSGMYRNEVYNKDGDMSPSKNICLCVLDPISKPDLKVQCNQPDIKLTCAVEKVTYELKFEWLQNNKVLGKKTEATLTLNGEKDSENSFICKVHTPAKTVMTSPSVQPQCTNLSGRFPDEIFGLSIWIFVGGGGGVVLVLIVVIILCCVKAKRKRSTQLKDEEELRLGWTNPQQSSHPHHHHHHHHHQQQQPAGHTGPRQHRSKQQRPRPPNPNNVQPEPTPMRCAQAPGPVADDEEQPPPLPQPRKKIPKTQRM